MFATLALLPATAGRLVVDSAGRQVEVPDQIERVIAICMAAAIEPAENPAMLRSICSAKYSEIGGRNDNQTFLARSSCRRGIGIDRGSLAGGRARQGCRGVRRREPEERGRRHRRTMAARDREES